MTRSDRTLIGLTGIAHALDHLYILILPAIMTLLAHEFGRGLFSLSLVANASYLAFGLGALPAGFLSDRMGPKRALIAFLLGASLSTAAIALSPSLLVLTVSLTMLGFFCGLYHPSGTVLISLHASKKGLAFGYHGMMGSLGLALAPFFAAALASSWGWRSPYLLAGSLGLIGAFVIHKLLRYDGGPVSSIKEGPLSGEKEQGGALWGPLLIIYLIAVLNGLIYRGIMTFLPLYLADGYEASFLAHSSIAKGGLLTSLALLAGFFGQYLGGHLSQRFSLELVLPLLTAMSLPFMFLMGLTQNLTLLLVVFFFVFFHFSCQPVVNALTASYTSMSRRGLGYGMYFLLIFGGGSFASGLGGYVGENYGLSKFFLLLSVIVFLSLLCSFFLLALGKKRGFSLVAPVASESGGLGGTCSPQQGFGGSAPK